MDLCLCWKWHPQFVYVWIAQYIICVYVGDGIFVLLVGVVFESRICGYIYIYIYMYTCIYISIYIYIYIYMYPYLHICCIREVRVI